MSRAKEMDTMQASAAVEIMLFHLLAGDWFPLLLLRLNLQG